VETFVASVAFGAAVAWCVERLVHARDSRWALPPLAIAVLAWAWLWSVRTPSAGRALLAFTLADLAVLAIGVVATLRLLGGFGRESWQLGEEGDDGGNDDGPPHDPDAPPPGPPPTRVRHARHDGPHPTRRPPHPARRPRRVSGTSRSATGSAR
jgi:hypothetical protein